METITEEEFLQRIKKHEPLVNVEVSEDYALIADLRIGSTIRNCKFRSIVFSNISGLNFDGCQANDLKIKGENASSIHLTNCKITNLDIDIESNGKKVVTDVTIEGNESVYEKILFRGSYKKIRIDNTTHIKKIDFHFITADDIDVSNVNESHIHFSNSTVNKSAFFLSNRGTHLDFFETTTKHIGVLTPTDLKIDLISCKSDTVTLSDGSYEFIHFQGTGEYDFRFRYSKVFERIETKIGTINFSNFLLVDKSRIKFLDVLTDELRILDFENNGTLSFSNCIIENKLAVAASNLGKTIFNNTAAQGSVISIIDSNIIDTTFTNFKWRPDYQLSETEQSPLPSLRESYRQLKANYLKGGNKIEALEFQKHELRVHYQIVREEKFKKPFFRNMGNFLVIGTNKWSSDFGQNIWKPLLLLFGFHLLFFNAFLFANSDLGIHADLHWDYELFLRGVRLYFQTLLPVHSTEIRFANGVVVPIAGFWDFLIRVSSGYFIFYFISASRKYHQ